MTALELWVRAVEVLRPPPPGTALDGLEAHLPSDLAVEGGTIGLDRHGRHRRCSWPTLPKEWVTFGQERQKAVSPPCSPV